MPAVSYYIIKIFCWQATCSLIMSALFYA